jgi:transcriptional regulator with XRE-family HTH domain
MDGSMSENKLPDYLRQMMDELNYASERSFANYLKVSYSTVNRILKGEKVDPDSLLRIAEALHVPVETVYRLAGYLPPEEMQTQVLREIEHLLREMPEADQRRILDLVRVEYKHTQAKQPNEEQPRRDQQKAG